MAAARRSDGGTHSLVRCASNVIQFFHDVDLNDELAPRRFLRNDPRIPEESFPLLPRLLCRWRLLRRLPRKDPSIPQERLGFLPRQVHLRRARPCVVLPLPPLKRLLNAWGLHYVHITSLTACASRSRAHL